MAAKYIKAAKPQRPRKSGAPIPKRTCGACGSEIEVGQPYYRYDYRLGRSSGTKLWCEQHPPRPSQLTFSEEKGIAYALVEAFEDLCEGGRSDMDDLISELESARDTVRDEIAEGLRSKAQNIEDGFGHETSASSELNERADNYESWADEIDDALSTIEGLKSELEEIDDEERDTEEVDDETETDDKRQELLNDALSAADQAMASCPE